jgi:oligosaccharide 4-alpha-D-glucosyltransferase
MLPHLLRIILLAVGCLLAVGRAGAQAVATISPAQPASLSDSLTVTFDATRGDGGLATWPGDVYVHSGVITPASTDLTDWQHVQGTWGLAEPRLRMRPLGNHRYMFRFRPDTFYGLAAGERVYYLAFVFRNADGTASGRNANGSDVLLPLYSATTRSYLSHQWTGGILSVTTSDGATLTVQPYAPAVLRVAFYPSGVAAVPTPSFAVNAAAAGGAATVADTPARLTLAAGGITLDVRKNPLRLLYRRGADTLLVETPGYFETGPVRGVRFGLKPGEALYGTGSRALPTNRRGQRVELYNQAHYGYQNGEANLNISIPLVLSGRGYGLLFDDHRPGYLDLGLTDDAALEFGTENNRLTYFVLADSTLPALLSTYTSLTGRQPLPPRWALGYIQSKYGYQTEVEARSIVQSLRRQNFPLSGLVLDLYWFGSANRMGDLNWDRTRFPTPGRMMHDFDSVGVKTVLITEPYLTLQSSNYGAARAGGFLARTIAGAPYVLGSFWAGPAALLDMSDPAARAWLWPFYRARTLEGVGGWWSDLGEPEDHPDLMRHAGGTAREVHNVFSQHWAQLLHDQYRQEFPTQRLFNLSRSGFAGMQRLSAIPWSGDVQRTWSGLQAQVPIMLGMGLSGVGYMHSDAGGFTGGPQNNELYTRWLQFAAFTPIMRAHGEGVPTEPVFYPEPYRSIVRDYAHLRHRLLPTTYTLAWENSVTGTPLARPVNWEHTSSSSSNDTYLWGSNLLVAPVLSPGQTQRTVSLPNSGPWIDYWTRQVYPGGSTVTVAAPLSRLPLFVRGEGFVALQPYRSSTAQGVLDTLQLSYYPIYGGNSNPYFVYDDDGRTPNAYANGQYQLLRFQDYPTGAADMTIVATASGNGYPGAPRQREIEYNIQRVSMAPGRDLRRAEPGLVGH